MKKRKPAKRKPRKLTKAEAALADALSETVYYEGKNSGRLVTVENAVKYRRADLVSYGNTHAEALQLASETCERKLAFTELYRVEKAIHDKAAAFAHFELPQQRVRGILRHD